MWYLELFLCFRFDNSIEIQLWIQFYSSSDKTLPKSSVMISPLVGISLLSLFYIKEIIIIYINTVSLSYLHNSEIIIVNIWQSVNNRQFDVEKYESRFMVKSGKVWEVYGKFSPRLFIFVIYLFIPLFYLYNKTKFNIENCFLLIICWVWSNQETTRITFIVLAKRREQAIEWTFIPEI